MMFNVKRKFVKVRQYWKGKESKIFSGIIFVAVLFMLMRGINEKATEQLKNDNIRLQNELLNTQTKLQTTYYIILRQGETIDILKFDLSKCKGDTLWTPEKEIR